MKKRNSTFWLGLILVTIMILVGCSDDENGTGNNLAPLRLLNVGPFNGADSIAVDASVWAIFSRELDSASVAPAAFYLNNDSGNAVPGQIFVAGQTATFTADNDLRRGATYTAHVTTAIGDIHGYHLPSADNWSFTTIPPATIELLGSATTPSLAWSLDLANDYAFVADVDSGLQIFRVAEPSFPMFVAAFDSISAAGITAAGDYAYLCGNLIGSGPSNGLYVIDVSNPAQPTRVGSLEGLGWSPDADTDGDYVYIADYDVGLHVVSVVNPANPILAATLPVDGTPYGVFAGEYYVFVTTEWTEWAEWQGMHIVDVSNPLSPFVVSSLPTTDRAMDVHVTGDYACIAADSAGLRVVNIFNPAQPTEVGHYTVDDAAAFDVFSTSTHAYVADYNHGLQIFDITIPSDPHLIATYDTPGACREVVVQGNDIFIADYQAGLQILTFNPQ